MKPLFLVGYMAAGKTTLGRRAAQLLNVEFIDLDDYIESRYRKRISDLFAERGEEGFRDIERRMLHEVAEFDNVLVATGGGTPCFFDNMEYMRHRGVTIYLAASVQTLCRRLSHAKVKRPLVAGKTPEELYEYITEMLNRRESYYRQADYRFDADGYESLDSVDEAVHRLAVLMQNPAYGDGADEI
ncbi:shikimate kinase [Barnesiella sp. B2-R-119]|uniref:shikimate kinase n=1 Tax=Barnesiella sp. B2-R-119 TaxID=2949656 RepID=UPI00202F6296|nr:shikimate kinase [Barnesiella sp. B2-R-119]MCM0688672.1 shikimate kinase [Barnesiella sp. B2-R-119]